MKLCGYWAKNFLKSACEAGGEGKMAKKIYIVDDDKDIVDVLTTIFDAHGYETVASYSAQEALRDVHKVKPDLIILDVMFPENSSGGFDVAREWAKNESIKNTPIIILSAINEKYRLGFSGKDIDNEWLPVSEFVEKPIIPEKILRLVEKYLGK